MFALLACGLGLYIGLQFNVFALLPLAVLGSMAYVLAFWFGALTPPHSTGQFIAALLTMQLGYFVGLTARVNYRHLIVRLKTGHSSRI